MTRDASTQQARRRTLGFLLATKTRLDRPPELAAARHGRRGPSLDGVPPTLYSNPTGQIHEIGEILCRWSPPPERFKALARAKRMNARHSDTVVIMVYIVMKR